MNPLLDVRTNLTNNRKEFEQETVDYTSFKSTVDPILQRLRADPANQQGFFTRFIYSPSATTQNLTEAVEKTQTHGAIRSEVVSPSGRDQRFQTRGWPPRTCTA